MLVESKIPKEIVSTPKKNNLRGRTVFLGGNLHMQIKSEKQGFIYRHYTGAGLSGHHRNPFRAYQVASMHGFVPAKKNNN